MAGNFYLVIVNREDRPVYEHLFGPHAKAGADGVRPPGAFWGGIPMG